MDRRRRGEISAPFISTGAAASSVVIENSNREERERVAFLRMPTRGKLKIEVAIVHEFVYTAKGCHDTGVETKISLKL